MSTRAKITAENIGEIVGNDLKNRSGLKLTLWLELPIMIIYLAIFCHDLLQTPVNSTATLVALPFVVIYLIYGKKWICKYIGKKRVSLHIRYLEKKIKELEELRKTSSDKFIFELRIAYKDDKIYSLISLDELFLKSLFRNIKESNKNESDNPTLNKEKVKRYNIEKLITNYFTDKMDINIDLHDLNELATRLKVKQTKKKF